MSIHVFHMAISLMDNQQMARPEREILHMVSLSMDIQFSKEGAVNYPYTHPQQGAFTQSPYGQMTNENTQVMNPYSQAPVGQQNGQSASSASPYGQSSSGRQIGQQSFVQQQFGQPLGQQTYGQQQFGQQFGQPPKKKVIKD